MSANFVLHLRAEISELEQEIRSDPRYRRRQRLRELLTEYEPVRGAERPSTPAPRGPAAPPEPSGEAEDDVFDPQLRRVSPGDVFRQSLRRRG